MKAHCKNSGWQMFDCLNDQMITFLSAAEDWWLVTVRGPGRISTTPRCSLLLSVSDSDLTHCLQLQNPLISVLDSWVPVSISQSLIYLLMECLLGLGGKISKKSISDVLLFSAPLCLSPLTQCLQLRIPCSDCLRALQWQRTFMKFHRAWRRSLLQLMDLC